MPKITKSQLQGNFGETTLLAVTSKFGWLGETVRHDFGEDIVFQFSWKGTIEPYKIVCQVKTTRSLKINVSVETVKKWLLSLDHFIIVVVDPDAGAVFYTPLHTHFSLDDVWRVRKKTLSFDKIHFSELSLDEACFIEWNCRIRALNRLLLENRGWQDYADSESDDYLDHQKKSNLVSVQIAGLTLQYMGLVTLSQEGLQLNGKEVVNYLLAFRKTFFGRSRETEEKERLTLSEALWFLILFRLTEVAEPRVVPIPGGLLDATHRLLHSLAENLTAEVEDALQMPLV